MNVARLAPFVSNRKIEYRQCEDNYQKQHIRCRTHIDISRWLF